MYIHTGSRKIVSDKKIVGIFRIETLAKSDENKRFLKDIGSDDKTIFLEIDNTFFTGSVSSASVIKRTGLDFACIWRRGDE